MKPLILLSLIIVSWTAPALAQNEVDLEGARIFGNKELPNITYIVPWQDERLDTIEIQPIGNLFEEALEPVDREIFKRKIELYQLLQKTL
ncbi:hypothetical protein MNBD_GAMMA16-1497 [hydrothermal vent metagenome]|uniref:Uncharacterized protein n=1 Tax=hydrothermal vent metagenome TaxID=652676 RepID=A0A3B0Z7R3_9ZZZZ